MIAFGFPDTPLAGEFELAHRLGASCLEILPDWSNLKDPHPLRLQAADQNLAIHSVHGCFGMRRIRGGSVDLASLDPHARQDSVDNIRQCVDWSVAVGARFLVVHPGNLSDESDTTARSASLAVSLIELADHSRGSNLTLCVENMPPGVHPGNQMADLARIVGEVAHPEVALALDTGHAHIVSSAAQETLATGTDLRTVHVHDNDGRRDIHLPPGHGTVDWPAWRESLDRVGYQGPIMLECIRHLRRFPHCIDDTLLSILRELTASSPIPPS